MAGAVSIADGIGAGGGPLWWGEHRGRFGLSSEIFFFCSTSPYPMMRCLLLCFRGLAFLASGFGCTGGRAGWLRFVGIG